MSGNPFSDNGEIIQLCLRRLKLEEGNELRITTAEQSRAAECFGFRARALLSPWRDIWHLHEIPCSHVMSHFLFYICSLALLFCSHLPSQICLIYLHSLAIWLHWLVKKLCATLNWDTFTFAVTFGLLAAPYRNFLGLAKSVCREQVISYRKLWKMLFLITPFKLNCTAC